MKQLSSLFLILILLIPHTSISQEKMYRKKYVDSLRHELSLYQLSSYNHLAFYNRCEDERKDLVTEINRLETTQYKMRKRAIHQNIMYGGFFGGICIMFLIILKSTTK